MIRKIFSCLVLFYFFSQEVLATHIRAGEIQVIRLSNSTLAYRFSIIGYTDTGSTVEFGGGQIDFGDGTVLSVQTDATKGPVTNIEDGVEKHVFFIEHTFQGPGRYTVRFTEQNRNAGVQNMSNSVDTPFYVETDVLIDPFVGINNSPIFLVPPIDHGAVSAAFLHNPGAFDKDGDSLSYRLTKPKQFFDRVVNDYFAPNAAKFYNDPQKGNQAADGPPVFQIDSLNGNLLWDAPGAMGEYNIAFVVDEWRKLKGEWFNIGSVTRDMQIIVEESDNKPPMLEEIPELCVLAGENIMQIVTATDPDGDKVELEAFGGPFQFENSPAIFRTPNPILQEQPGTLTIEWQTNCSHVRERPYEIQLKVRDAPEFGPRLVDFGIWNVTVVGPAPTGLQTTLVSGRRMQLDWDAYGCGSADSLEIWRRVDSYEIMLEDCVVGMPANAGYEMIDIVDILNETYLDENGGLGLAPGALYCYRIVARYPSPGGGKSYVSEEACEPVDVIAPVTLNVDVRTTDTESGEIYLRWEEPFDLDLADFPRPFTYEVIRFEGQSGTNSRDTIASTQAKEFTDTGLNTEVLAYNYLIHAYDNDGVYIDSSFPASSVWITAQSAVETITLSWSANVPWSNVSADYPTHDVFRATDDGFGALNFDLIGSANVTMTGMQFIDDGTFNDEPLDDEVIYYYYAETKGTYGNNNFPEPLLNKSQVVSAQPNDLIAPCTPVSFRVADDFDCSDFLANRGCDFADFSTKLVWDQDGESVCDNDIRSYNIYYSETDSITELPLLVNVERTEYLHENKDSFKGYYQIASVDRSGNISERSEIIALDNCPFIMMPNVFSPNGDNINDFFTPIMNVFKRSGGEGGDGSVSGIEGFNNANCPRFVLDIQFKVFDRTGGVLFIFDSQDGNGEIARDLSINWDGTTNTGRKLSSGTYYYSLIVSFDVLDPKQQSQTYSGWVQIIR